MLTGEIESNSLPYVVTVTSHVAFGGMGVGGMMAEGVGPFFFF